MDKEKQDEKQTRILANQKAVQSVGKDKANTLKDKFRKMEEQVAKNN